MNVVGPDAGRSLAERQTALVATLVGDGPLPAGFDPVRVGAARRALLHKRAGEVAAVWPLLAVAHGDRWVAVFSAWAAGRPPNGSLRDGWDLARSLGAELPALAAEELALREVCWRYDGVHPPQRRRVPALRRVGGYTAVQLFGHVQVLGGSPR